MKIFMYILRLVFVLFVFFCIGTFLGLVLVSIEEIIIAKGISSLFIVFAGIGVGALAVGGTYGYTKALGWFE